MTLQHLLAFIWFGIVGFGIIMYVLLDGFDLGIGVLQLFMRDQHQRDLMISSILPVWDGNETWLVLGGAVLYGAFPEAFGTLLPVLYVPIIIMVCALLFRGIVFEFRFKAEEHKKNWDVAFFVGSIVATFMQGLMLGTFVQGFVLASDGTPANMTFYSGLHYQWLTPFSLLCALGLLFGYLLLGANWLIAKSTGAVQQFCYEASKFALFAVLLFGFLVSIWSPFVDPDIKARWFDPKHIYYFALLPLATLVVFYWHWRALKERKEHAPFWLSIAIFLLCYVGFVISCWPYIVPRHITYLEAAAPSGSLLFMLVGAVIMLPILLYYTYHSYRIFRGKVTEPVQY